jgi:hypothetical protein
MGRDGPSSRTEDDEGTDTDAFRLLLLLLPSASDLRVNLSNIGAFGWNTKSICRELRAFGVRWLNCVSRECGSITIIREIF